MQKTSASKSLSKREFGVVESNKIRTQQKLSKYVLIYNPRYFFKILVENFGQLSTKFVPPSNLFFRQSFSIQNN